MLERRRKGGRGSRVKRRDTRKVKAVALSWGHGWGSRGRPVGKILPGLIGPRGANGDTPVVGDRRGAKIGGSQHQKKKEKKKRKRSQKKRAKAVVSLVAQGRGGEHYTRGSKSETVLPGREVAASIARDSIAN